MQVTRKIFRRFLVLMLAAFFLASPQLNGRGDNVEPPLDKSNSVDSVSSVVKHKNDPESAAGVSPALSICSQHAPKCPLTTASWPGEPDGWQYTGKQWIWVPGTRDLDRDTVWEYSQPYSGSTQEYFGQREDQYASCSSDPQDCSITSGIMPETYDWERWMQVGDNFKLMQLGRYNEFESHKVGDVDCASGIYYPVVDHTIPYYSTPMYSDITGACTGGGYVAAFLSEQWGQPLSQKRLSLCDNVLNGVPADLSPTGNTICKISPYVGVIYQRYIFGASTPAELPGVGCEAVLYAWGWTEPQSPSTGQKYQSWFRNGELRFTRWFNLSNEVTIGNIPNPDDHDWWNPRCQAAWEGEGNWVYSGTFWAGSTIYQDQAVLPTTAVQVIPPSGGSLDVAGSGVQYAFPAGVFTQTVQVVSYLPDQSELPPTDGLFKIVPAHYIFAETPAGKEPVDPTAPYTVTLSYADQAVGGLEISLAFYYWDGYGWVKEPTSQVDEQANTLTATPDHFSLWAVMVDGRRMYLPAVLLDK